MNTKAPVTRGLFLFCADKLIFILHLSSFLFYAQTLRNFFEDPTAYVFFNTFRKFLSLGKTETKKKP